MQQLRRHGRDRQRPKGTFNDLLRAYTGSVESAELAASTQAEYKRMLTKAEPRFGSMLIKAFDDARVKERLLEWRDEIVRASAKREGDSRCVLGVTAKLIAAFQASDRQRCDQERGGWPRRRYLNSCFNSFFVLDSAFWIGDAWRSRSRSRMSLQNAPCCAECAPSSKHRL